MSIKSLQIGLTGLFVCVASAWAGSSLQGVVTDPAGQPLKNAEIRVEPRNGGYLITATKTDAKGRYATVDLPAATYRVTLLVNGAVKASINNTKTRPNKPTELNFQLKPASASQPAGKKTRHMVWVPARTGSHTGGSWVEVDQGGAAAAGATNTTTVNAEELQRQVHSMDQKPPSP